MANNAGHMGNGRGRSGDFGWLLSIGVLLCVAMVSLAIHLCGRALERGNDNLRREIANQQQSMSDMNAERSEIRAAQEAKDEEAQAAEQAKPEPVDVSLVMVGDILMHDYVYNTGFADDGTCSYDHMYAHILPELEGQDLVMLNQETPLGGIELGLGSYPVFNGPQEIGDAEVAAGFNVAFKATNHAMDAGYEGVSSELEFWKSKYPDVLVIGEVDPNDESASVEDVTVYEKDGFKIALLNYTYGLNGFEDPLGCVSMLEEDHVASTMTKAHELADFVIVVPHWGDEYVLEPVDWQRAWAEMFVDYGADLIIGAHPHVLEPVEVLTSQDGTNSAVCFWSLGNFISAQPDDMMLVGGMAKVTLHKDSDGECSVTSARLLPTVTHLGYGYDMTTYLLRDWTDELCYSAYRNRTLTPAWANAFCAEVLGEGYDTETKEFTLAL